MESLTSKRKGNFKPDVVNYKIKKIGEEVIETKPLSMEFIPLIDLVPVLV